MDWAEFEALVERHRVAGLVWRALSARQADIPAATSALLSTRARAIARDNMFAAAECEQLSADFAGQAIPLIHLKGLAISALAYGDPYLKMSADIDLLVAPGSILAAAHILEKRGYHCSVPGGSIPIEHWHRRNKESVWVRTGARKSLIDLHSALCDPPTLLPGVAIPASPRLVVINDETSLLTLHRDETFAYLCVHGAWGSWFRLKWIADLYALHRGDSPGELERLFDRAAELGAGRAAGSALLLASDLFGLELGPALRQRIEAVRAHPLLAKLAMRQLRTTMEPTQRRLGTLPLHAAELLLLPGWRFKISEAFRQTSSFARNKAAAFTPPRPSPSKATELP